MNENERNAVLSLKKALKERFGLVDLYVFGSKVRGDSSPDSDIDVMIQIESYTPEIEAAIDDLVFEINLVHDCVISTVMFGRDEIEEGPWGESPLYRTVREEGLRI